MKTGNFIDRWLGYSIRRKFLDEALCTTQSHMTGAVLEIGNGRAIRRGRFTPPVGATVSSWKFLDRRAEVSPDLLADVTEMPVPSESIDTVVCLEVLEYVPDYLKAFREIHRVLKPNGGLVLSIPFLHHSDSSEDYHRLTENGLKDALQKNGFFLEKFFTQGAALATAASILKRSVVMVKMNVPRLLLGVLAYAPIQSLVFLDGPSVRWAPDLRRFSTGYLMVARKVVFPQ